VGIFAIIVPLFGSPVTLAVSQANLSLLCTQKIPFPARVVTANTIRQAGNLGGLGDQARRLEPSPLSRS
jgi:hypothetical protein